MPTEYKINLVNQTGSKHTFWSFLSKPEISNTKQVFANSNVALTIDGDNVEQLNSFTIPVQYLVGVGASNHPVGLGTKIESSTNKNTNLGAKWEVTYYTLEQGGHPQGPSITGPESYSKPEKILMNVGQFDKRTSHANNWYENMSFGIKTDMGFMGISWEPEAGMEYIITPKLEFYISIGEYESYSLADITEVASKAQVIKLEDFDNFPQCTVIRTDKGGWELHKGTPTNEMVSIAKRKFSK